MEMKTLGRSGPKVGEIGLGCMGMSPGVYGPNDEAEGIATIRAAIDAGITLIDTGDFYGMGHNEMLIRRALENVPRSNVVISVKFGALRDPAGMFGGNDSRPQAVKNFLSYSLRRLGTDYIDLYRPARLDPAVPIEDTVGAIADMIRAGYVRHVGLSEVGAEIIKRAHAVHPIVDLQIEADRMPVRLVRQADDGDELGVLLRCHTLFARGGPMRGDAVAAAVSHADRHINELLGQGVECAQAHDLFGVRPHAPQARRMIREDFPVVVDPVDLARRHDVVVHRAHLRGRVGILDGRMPSARGAHGTIAITRAGKPAPSATFGVVTQTRPPASGT